MVSLFVTLCVKNTAYIMYEVKSITTVGRHIRAIIIFTLSPKK